MTAVRKGPGPAVPSLGTIHVISCQARHVSRCHPQHAVCEMRTSFGTHLYFLPTIFFFFRSMSASIEQISFTFPVLMRNACTFYPLLIFFLRLLLQSHALGDEIRIIKSQNLRNNPQSLPLHAIKRETLNNQERVWVVSARGGLVVTLGHTYTRERMEIDNGTRILDEKKNDLLFRVRL